MSTVLDPIRVKSGWAAVRVTYREREGFAPIEKAEASIKSAVSTQKIDAKISEYLKDWRKRLNLKTYPERLPSAG